MNQPIVFTPEQFFGVVLGICAAVACIGNAIAWIAKGKAQLMAPERRQDERITDLEKRVARHDEMLDNDNKRLEAIEEGNRVTQRAILALLAHSIDGNDIEKLQKAMEALQDYLIKR